jgi:DNA polymerase-3 subunit gamma/tau
MQSAPAQQANDPDAIAMPARAAPAPAKAPYAYVITPVPELNWDGNWPAVAAAAAARHRPATGDASRDGQVLLRRQRRVFALRVPIETWRTPGNVEKLTAALAERFGRTVRVDTELGAVWYTASAEAQAYREACQRAAEETVANDPS